MSNATKTRISELTALTSASLDTTIVGVDNGVTYKIELDTLADAVTTRVNILDRDRLAALEFATSSFETKGRNVVSGSSQLTSSYDTRYVISGSIGAVPVGTVSGSSQVLGGSGVWSGSAQLPSGIISGSSQLNNQTITNLTITNLTTVNQTASVLYTSGSNQLGDELGDIQTLSGSVRVQGSLTINGTSVSTQSFVDVSALNSATSSYETNGRSIISSSAQISDLGFVTGSYTTINSFNSLTQSFNSISQSFNVISGSVGTIDFSTLATTGSNIFSGSQTISGGLSINNSGYSWSFESNGRTKIPNITFNSDRGTGMVGIKPAPGREFQIETSTAESSVGPWSFGLDGTLSAPVGANILRVGNLLTTSSFNSYTASQSTSSLVDRLNTIESVSGSWITESETGSFLTSLSGAISSSSQLTSSYDTRYTLSGSVQPLPSNLLSSSAQITAFGFISSSTTIDTGSLVTTSSFNSYTASLNAFSSSLSVTANSSTKILDAYYTSAAAWSGSYSGNGGTVKVEANFALYSTSIGTKTFTLFRNGIAVDSGSFYFNNTDVHATMPTLYYIGTNETGTNTYSVGHNAVSDAGDSCNIVVTETFNTLNAGLISGSSQLTSSYDTRYVISGSVGATPSGTISGSAQITAFGFISSSQTINTASLATTGSNSFNGNQTITGSLVVGSVAVVNGGITIPTGSVISLTSGSSISVDSSGTITSLGGITGSIAATNGVVSGSSQLTSAFPSKTTGTWSVPAGASTQSFTVEAGASYTMWVNGNIPNGIITWNATVTTTNTNVPVVGSQHGWYYTAGNALVLTSMPDQITGTNGSIVNTPSAYAPNTSNVFKFGITNNSGTSQTINYGYIKLS